MKQTDLSLSQRRDYFGIFFPFLQTGDNCDRHLRAPGKWNQIFSETWLQNWTQSQPMQGIGMKFAMIPNPIARPGRNVMQVV